MTNAIKRFFAMPTAPGILLCIATILAVLMENSFFQESYHAFKHTPVVLQIGAFKIDKDAIHWINDGLMAIFFLLVGLEIKREILEGHLSSLKQSTLPAVAALGGIIAPAVIYYIINIDSPETVKGWAIPAATDIAFALGILMLLGDRVPASLKVCLVAIAIIDDLAAIVIIALFYTDGVSLFSLGLAAGGLGLAFLCNKKGVTRLDVYVLLGLFIWACVLKSGVHATLAGVALGLCIPLRATNANGKSPLKVLEHELHPLVAFIVLPIFAYVNAGVSFAGLNWHMFLDPITLGVILGLVVGKQVGVVLFTIIGIALKICSLPDGVNWKQYYGMALLTGIGFTMSLFIGTLAFDSDVYISEVRLGVLCGSVISGIAGVSMLLMTTTKTSKNSSS